MLPPPKPDPLADWPELAKAVEERRSDRQEESTAAQAYAQHAAGAFALRQHDPHRYERPEQVQALFDEWDPPVFDLLCRMAGLAWQGCEFTLRTKAIPAPHNQSQSLYWEALQVGKFVRSWFTVELELDSAYRPARFLVECARPRPGAAPMRLPTEPSLEALRIALAEAYRRGPLVARRSEKPGRILRRERIPSHE